MDLTSPYTTSPARGTRSSVSAVLIVGLLIGVAVSSFKPGLRGLSRDAESQGQVTRQITATLARAVRELVGSDLHRPAVATSASKLGRIVRPTIAEVQAGARMPAASMLREALLALPPPAA